MKNKSVQEAGFFSFDIPNFPTFKAAARQHRTTTLLFFLTGYSLVILALMAVILVNQQLGLRAPVRASQVLPLNTAYGSQRHVFTQADGKVTAIYLDESGQVVAATSQDGGVTWQELPQPLVSEAVDNVAGAQDKEENLHLVYERKRRIIYQKVNTAGEPWSVSQEVALDDSRLGHRPSLILDENSQLPLVAWSSEFKGTPLRGARILFMAARADPTKLANWCNASQSLCGVSAFYILGGSSDILGSRASYSTYHPVLAQMPQNGDLYLWWSELLPSGKGVLNLVVGKKVEGVWLWEKEVSQEDQLESEAARNFTLSAISDPTSEQAVVAYVARDGKAKTVAYAKGKEKKELGTLGELGDQFSLTESEGNYYLFYRNLEGRVGLRKFDSLASPVWSRELWQSGKTGGHPASFTGPSLATLPFIYVTPENQVVKTSFSLITPTPTPTLEPTPTASPSPTLEPTPEATSTPTPEPTATPTPEPTATPTPEATPTATPTPEATP